MEAILITAGGRRIGKCMSKTLADHGYYIYIHYHHDCPETRETLRNIQKAGGKGELVQCDLDHYDQVEGLLSRCQNPEYPLRHLINNASQFIDDSLLDFTEDGFCSHQNVNLRAPLQLARALHRLIPQKAKGSVINILDSKVFALNPDFHSYSLSKYALYGATEMMAQALAPKIRVNAIAPGLTLISESQSKENFHLASHLNYVGEPLKVEDIANTAQLLIESPSINGATIPVDGGQKMINFTGDVVHVAESILKEK